MERYIKADIGIIRLGKKVFAECRFSHRISQEIASSIKACIQKEFGAVDTFFNPNLQVIDAVGVFRVEGLTVEPEGYLSFTKTKTKKGV